MFIGIGGVSRSGKSSLAMAICNYYRGQDKTSMILTQDDFVKPLREIPRIKTETDWEHPASLRHAVLRQTLAFYTLHFDVIILDGFLAFYDPDLVVKYDLKIFIEISKPTFLKRKAEDKRWGFIPEWYFEHIWTSYERYGIPENLDASYVRLNGEIEYSVPEILGPYQ
jgi:nicotinamide/nicotinate riboside kinase